MTRHDKARIDAAKDISRAFRMCDSKNEWGTIRRLTDSYCRTFLSFDNNFDMQDFKQKAGYYVEYEDR